MTDLGKMLRDKVEREAQAVKDASIARELLRTEKERHEFEVMTGLYENAKKFFVQALESNYPSKEIFVQVGGSRNYRALEDERVHRPSPASSLEACAFFGWSRDEPDVCLPSSRFAPLWAEMKQWATLSGLVVYWQYCHDGVGIESWWQLRIKPAPVAQRQDG